MLCAAGCGTASKAYYGAWEKVGYHKRDILVSRVEKARDGQEEAKETFKDALERFKEVVDVDGGDLQAKYDKLRAELKGCERRAGGVHDRVDSVEKVAEALFKEWNGELDQYTDAGLRHASEQQLRDTRRSYDRMFDAMRKAESTIDPVISAFRNQVLFLKHNLNARAIASIQTTAAQLEGDIAALICDMERSIA
jgi:hypothetical protein